MVWTTLWSRIGQEEEIWGKITLVFLWPLTLTFFFLEKKTNRRRNPKSHQRRSPRKRKIKKERKRQRQREKLPKKERLPKPLLPTLKATAWSTNKQRGGRDANSMQRSMNSLTLAVSMLLFLLARANVVVVMVTYLRVTSCTSIWKSCTQRRRARLLKIDLLCIDFFSVRINR